MARTGAGLLCAIFAAGLASAQARTYTKLSPVTRDASGHSVVTATVTDDTGQPVAGAISLLDQVSADQGSGGQGSGAQGSGATRWLSGMALNAQGEATFPVDALGNGNHSLQAEYAGTAQDAASSSQPLALHNQTAAAVPDFTITLSPTTFTVKAGGTAATTITITPINGFTGFISLSCSGLPIDYVTCNNSPANLEINSAAAQTAVMNIQTTATNPKTAWLHRSPMPGRNAASGNGAFLAVLPGIFGLVWVSRKRRHMMRSMLLVLLATGLMMGTTGCSARYWYLHLGPIFGGTPTGTYTITVTAQTSNGVTAAQHSASVALTVQ